MLFQPVSHDLAAPVESQPTPIRGTGGRSGRGSTLVVNAMGAAVAEGIYRELQLIVSETCL